MERLWTSNWHGKVYRLNSNMIAFDEEDAKALWVFLHNRQNEGDRRIHEITMRLEQVLWDKLSIEEMGALGSSKGGPS